MPSDEIEVLDVPHQPYARVRVRESGPGWSSKASVFLGAQSLDELGASCVDMARRLRAGGVGSG